MENKHKMKDRDIIVSINVHENPEFLFRQIENIKKHILFSNEILLNCNFFMAETLKNVENENFRLNPLSLEKRRYHGSLTKGIFSNIEYALENYNFKYFLVMSSREFFYNKLSDYSQIINNKNNEKYKNYFDMEWHWPIFRNTKLFQYFKENDLFYSCSAHEGMCFDVESCKHIVKFLNNHRDIKIDLFDFEYCVEEFALPSICCNFNGFYYVGNGVYEKSLDQLDKNKLTYKIRK